MNNLPQKPKFGEPCNNCGYCCANKICGIGKALLIRKAKPPCPFLYQLTNKKDGSIKFLCHLVVIELNSNIKNKIITDALGIGKGCCST